MKKAALVASLFILLGAGCDYDFDLNKKVTVRNPFGTEDVSGGSFEERSLSLSFEEGAAYDLRPTFLNVTGTVSDVLGDEEGLRSVSVTSLDDDGITLEWSLKTDDKVKRGSIEAKNVKDADRMLLPAFWEEGNMTTEKNGVLWLSRNAYDGLVDEERAEWGLGIGNSVVDAATGALRKFREITTKLFGEQEDVTTPFTLKKKGVILAFPMRIDGKVDHIRAIQASSWFADYVILDNPENPLILKISINPVAVGAMDAFVPLGVDTKEIGYEITSMKTASGR